MGNSKYGNPMFASQMAPTTSPAPPMKLSGLSGMGRFVDNDIILLGDRSMNAHESTGHYNPLDDNSVRRNYSDSHKDYKT
jgi:hypothetical protein